MRKRIIIVIAALLVLTTLAFAGCSLFTNTANNLANSGGSTSSGSSSNGTTSDTTSNTTNNTTTYNNVTKAELEAALTKYREIAETLSTRVSDLEEAVRQSISVSKANIGAYAVNYVDSVMSISCLESAYNLGCQGTGFIITADGYVITNNHVIYYEETVYDTENIHRGVFGYSYGTKKVTGVYSSITGFFDTTSQYYNEGNGFTLEFVYRDPAYDLALCKIVEAVPVGTSWKSIPFYDGDVVRGDELLVLGNAQGFGLSATSGLVSATGKTFTDYPKLTFIQTDAAINGGNSGGPAINIYGGLIGVVNSKFVSTNIENMGFAIERNKLKEFLTAAETNKEITVSYTTVSAPTVTTAA
ncbi:MAG: trypsin-like peptidase domain-containing protein [Clostridia bacterium]|nr:trypsin-like peptidase domain-containing protein [Clostridia bacterium]